MERTVGLLFHHATRTLVETRADVANITLGQ